MIKEIVNNELDKENNLLQTPCACDKKSNVWATLKIPIDSMSKENINKVFDAIRLLREAGISFDNGCGGCIDLELDWSLKGAYLIKSHKQPGEELK